MISFLPFDETDRHCFAGVESANPLIAYLDDETTTVIIDDNFIHVMPESDAYLAEFPSRAAAIIFASTIPETDFRDPEKLKSFGFRCC